MKSKLLTVSVVFLTTLAWLPLARAQVKSTGAVLGTVTDSSGAVIPDVNVTLRNTGTGIALAATTDAIGAYSFPVVPVGEYTLTVAKSGFKTSVFSAISVSALKTCGWMLRLRSGR